MPAQIVRVCPVCGDERAEAFLTKGSLTLVRCLRCSMLYASPIPAEFASGEYYNKTGAEYYLSSAKLESDYSPVRFARELRLFRKYCRQGAILDVGCSSGAFLFQLKQRFGNQYQVLGTDVSGAPLAYAESRGIPVIRGNFLERDFGNKKFDAVTFWAVLEHLLEPKRFLNKACSLLKNGGWCFVLVPNMESLAFRLLGAHYRYIYAQHLNYFTSAALKRLAGDSFSLVECRTSHFNPIVIWQDWKGNGREISNQKRGELLKRTTAFKQNPVLAPVKALYQAAEKLLAAGGWADNLTVVLQRTSG